jgi:mRNA interferase RelE/StbE
LAWQVEFLDSAEKQFAKLDTTVQRRILKFLRERISGDNDPRHTGKALTGRLSPCRMR